MQLLFQDFQLCTTNNGHLSSPWTPTRGLFQGNPIASFLFLFTAELLVIKLRSNPKIEGIEVKGIKYLLSQFTDDLDLFLKFKQSVWEQVMQEFDSYKLNTGMLISYDKTTIYQIGSLHHSNAKFTSWRKVSWVNNPLNILGIYVSHNVDEYIDFNLTPLINKTKNLLEVWSTRGLSLVGKAQIVNSLVSSLYVYKFTVLPLISKNTLECINRMVNKFIWNGKCPKIKLNILQLSKQEGGLGLANFQARDMALKANWVIRVINNAKLRNLANVLIGNPIDNDLWHCRLHKNDVNICFPHSSPFWRDVMFSWFDSTFDYLYSVEEFRNQIIWFNSELRIGNKPIFNKELNEKGLHKVSNLLDQNN